MKYAIVKSYGKKGEDVIKKTTRLLIAVANTKLSMFLPNGHTCPTKMN